MHSTRIALAAALLALGGAAQAQETTHTFYLGMAHFDINAKEPPLSGGPVLPAPGATLRIGSTDSVGFGYVYRFSEKWSAEVVLGFPPVHKIYGAGFLAPFRQIAEVEQMPPTVFLNYHFDNISPRIHPFVGLGVNYTHFPSARSTASGDAASGGPTTLSLSDSWGLAGHAGINVRYTKNWSLVMTVATADVQSNMTSVTTTPTATITQGTHITFRPSVYSISLGYSF